MIEVFYFYNNATKLQAMTTNSATKFDAAPEPAVVVSSTFFVVAPVVPSSVFDVSAFVVPPVVGAVVSVTLAVVGPAVAGQRSEY